MTWKERTFWLLWFGLMWFCMRSAEDRSLDAEKRMESLSYDTRETLTVFTADLTDAEERLEALESRLLRRRHWWRR